MTGARGLCDGILAIPGQSDYVGQVTTYAECARLTEVQEQVMRVIALMNTSSPRANHSLRVHEGTYALDEESITPAEIMELDAAGHVDWAHGRERQLVVGLAALEQDTGGEHA